MFLDKIKPRFRNSRNRDPKPCEPYVKQTDSLLGRCKRHQGRSAPTIPVLEVDASTGEALLGVSHKFVDFISLLLLNANSLVGACAMV